MSIESSAGVILIIKFDIFSKEQIKYINNYNAKTYNEFFAIKDLIAHDSDSKNYGLFVCNCK